MTHSAWITDRWLGRRGTCWSCAEPARAVLFTLLGWLDGPAGPATAAAWGYAPFCDACLAGCPVREDGGLDTAALRDEAQPLGATLEAFLQEHPVARHGLSVQAPGGAPAMAGAFPGPLRPAGRAVPAGWPDGRLVLPATAPAPRTPALGDGPDPWDAPDVDGARQDDVLERRMRRRAPARDDDRSRYRPEGW